MNWKEKNVLVTGGNGFFGSQIVRGLKSLEVENIISPNSHDYDLRIKEKCAEITKDVDYIFHLAAHVGGIGLNKEKPGELFYDNLMMGTNLMEEARKNNVEKFISLGTMCSYPKITPQPINENTLWDGYPEEVTAAYGLAKKMQIVQSLAYKDQYDFNSITVFVTNLYGPNDNFEGFSSHVVPSIINKIWQAKKNSNHKIELWGDGTPTRDFLYIDDAVSGLILAAEKYDSVESINLGTGVEVSIKDVAEMVMELMDIRLDIKWKKEMPNGQQRRCVDISKAKNLLGFSPKIDLKTGLKRTIDWYVNNQ